MTAGGPFIRKDCISRWPHLKLGASHVSSYWIRDVSQHVFTWWGHVSTLEHKRFKPFFRTQCLSMAIVPIYGLWSHGTDFYLQSDFYVSIVCTIQWQHVRTFWFPIATVVPVEIRTNVYHFWEFAWLWKAWIEWTCPRQTGVSEIKHDIKTGRGAFNAVEGMWRPKTVVSHMLQYAQYILLVQLLLVDKMPAGNQGTFAHLF